MSGTAMKVGQTRDLFVLRKDATEEFYEQAGTTTLDILAAERFADREEVDSFRTRVGQQLARTEGRVPVLEVVRIRIKAEQL